MKKVLIVDDSRTSRKILRSLFTENDFEVAGEAADGEEAVKLYKELKPDVVSMDITMPIMNGLDALGIIREYDPMAKVIMVTSAGQQSKMLEAVKRGAVDFITKPFEDCTVIEIFKKALEEDADPRK